MTPSIAVMGHVVQKARDERKQTLQLYWFAAIRELGRNCVVARRHSTCQTVHCTTELSGVVNVLPLQLNHLAVSNTSFVIIYSSK